MQSIERHLRQNADRISYLQIDETEFLVEGRERRNKGIKNFLVKETGSMWPLLLFRERTLC